MGVKTSAQPRADWTPKREDDCTAIALYQCKTAFKLKWLLIFSSPYSIFYITSGQLPVDTVCPPPSACPPYHWQTIPLAVSQDVLGSSQLDVPILVENLSVGGQLVLPEEVNIEHLSLPCSLASSCSSHCPACTPAPVKLSLLISEKNNELSVGRLDNTIQ